jgi:HK97 family phage portal protein
MNHDEQIKAIVNIPGWASDYLRNGVSGNEVAAYLAGTWAMRAIKIRANAISEARLCLYDRNGIKIEKHEALDVFNNSDWDAVSLMRYTESGLMVHGAGYWEKERNAFGKVKKLSYMNPRRVSPMLTGKGIETFLFSPINGGSVSLSPVDVVYFKGEYNPTDDLQGMSAMKWAIYSSIGEENADKYINAFWQNGATPATIIVDENPMPPDAEVKRQISIWERLFKGVNNQQKTAFVWGNKKIHTVGSTVKDLALDTVRTEMHRTISTAIGVPELLIAAVAATDITPVEMAYKIFYNQTVYPQWRYYESVLNKQLITEFPDLVVKGAYFEFDVSEVVALNSEEKLVAEKDKINAERLALLVEKGIIKKEVAAIELGYSANDIPEEPKPALPAEPQTLATGTATDSEYQEETKSDLEKWQKKALNALKNGKSPAVKFESDVLPAVEVARIQSGLSNAQTREDVLAAFERKSEPTEVEKLVEATLQLVYEYRNSHSE